MMPVPNDSSYCICPEVYVGVERANVRNIDDNCSEHGLKSEYYEGRLRYWNARLRILNEKRKRARRGDGKREH